MWIASVLTPQGIDLKSEVVALIETLPKKFEVATREMQKDMLKEAILFYKTFTAYILSCAESEKNPNEEFCPILSHINEFGNESVKKMRRWQEKSQRGVSRDEFEQEIKLENGKEEKIEEVIEVVGDEIDWDIGGTANEVGEFHTRLLLHI